MTTPTSYKCTTCQVLLPSAEELKVHHKSDWHRYNLKRKLAEMSPVTYEIFQRKLELLASTDRAVKGDSHLKRHTTDSIIKETESPGPPLSSSDEASSNNQSPVKYPSICHSLFDHHVAQSLDQNIAYMTRTFSFFIPDQEYLKDTKGLIQYLGDKLYEGHQCLYCNRPFKSLLAVRGHMISKGHTSIGTSTEEQEEELEPFFDYSESYKELNFSHLKKRTIAALKGDTNALEEEWQDEMSSDDEEIADLIARHGLDSARINEYGNLVLPGRGEAAHRAISYVFRQRLPTRHRDPSVRLALLHARQLRALTENGESALARERQARLSRQAQQQQTEARMRKSQRFDLSVGVKNNKLNRKMKTAEKYFI